MVAIVAGFCGIAHFLRHFDDPLAIVVVSNDASIVFTQETALLLTGSALRQAGLEPIEPEPAYSGPEKFVGRNSLRPADSVSVIWLARGGSYPRYTVRLERKASHVTARVTENWL